MIVKIVNDENKIIWEHGFKNNIRQGMSSKSYFSDGTLHNIIDALSLALYQANGEMQISKGDLQLAVSNERNGMSNGCTSTTQIKNDIPVAGCWY